jgi:hypothetical protein
LDFIELPKFERLAPKDFISNPLHRWLKFLDQKTSEEELKELTEMDQVIKSATEKLEYLSSDPETIALYRAREDALHERANMIQLGKSGRPGRRQAGNGEKSFIHGYGCGNGRQGRRTACRQNSGIAKVIAELMRIKRMVSGPPDVVSLCNCKEKLRYQKLTFF